MRKPRIEVGWVSAARLDNCLSTFQSSKSLEASLFLAAIYPRLFQLEYLSTRRVEDGLAMIEAFLPLVDEGGHFLPADDLRDGRIFGSDPMYSVKHTALQTTDLLNQVFR